MARARPALQLVGYGLVMALLALGALLVLTRRPPSQPVQLRGAPTPLPVRVHVTGAVAVPGVYTLPAGTIVQAAIQAAGGATAQADLSQINLARRLQDGDQVMVPMVAPTGMPVGPGTLAGTPQRGAPTAASAKINLNTATAADLETLPRIGPALAQNIVEYRNANGPFQRVEDIMLVSGIGPAIFDQIKDLVTVY